MNERVARAGMAIGLCTVLWTVPVGAQEPADGMASTMADMWHRDLGSGWGITAMGQVFPVVSIGAPGEDSSPFNDTGWYVTQPAVMANLTGAGGLLALRTTLNFEGVTQEDGELTYGGWGEGFIDKRHPHTLLHEFVLSLNLWDGTGGGYSLSGGKGFAPYGTDDPMSRPGLKYPTNHHLSQILERWFVSGALVRAGWGIEVSAFGGGEPEGPYDLGNIDSFADSWSARVSKRWPAAVAVPGWEVSVSHADVAEEHRDEIVHTRLWNGALRYEGSGAIPYGLIEASSATQAGDNDLFSVLGEMRLGRERHQPYLRLEYASRPEYERESGAGGFFRYEHDDEPIGSTEWFITTLAYEYVLAEGSIGLWPFVEVQHFRVREDRGGLDPRALFGTDSFWALTLGLRVFLGGDPMRMGTYGILDPMTAMGRMGESMSSMGME